ncbi:(S)-2-haloacid dehalogenase 4A [bacterium MnTg02]|nr:(S)-2-haloacid dehalogenase 4A [bacterium MnTg02]
MSAPKAYIFDAYGTLFDVHSAAGRLKDEIGPNADKLSQIWRDKQLQYTWIRALTGRHMNFESVTAAGLDFAIEAVGSVPEGIREKLLDAYMTLDAYPEVRDVLTALKNAGARLAILSNGTPNMLEAAVRSSQIGDLLDANISIEQAGIYKPSPKVYQLGVDTFSVPASEMSFQSSNRWDIAGAHAFGYRTMWINRTGQPDELLDMPPDRTVDTLRPLLELMAA